MLITAGLSGLMARRTLLLGITAWQAHSVTMPAVAAQRGAEDAYAPQRFDDTFVCAKRTPLGACAEQVKAVKPAAPAPLAPSGAVLEQTPVATTVPVAEESELIRGLLARSRENADANAREVREKTLKNSLGGQFGPFSKDAPVMKPDGAFEIVRISTLERYKDNNWVVTKSNGLDEWAPGFDKAAAEAAEAKKKAEKGKFLGIF